MAHHKKAVALSRGDHGNHTLMILEGAETAPNANLIILDVTLDE